MRKIEEVLRLAATARASGVHSSTVVGDYLRWAEVAWKGWSAAGRLEKPVVSAPEGEWRTTHLA